jgi:hypothetical protein
MASVAAIKEKVRNIVHPPKGARVASPGLSETAIWFLAANDIPAA